MYPARDLNPPLPKQFGTPSCASPQHGTSYSPRGHRLAQKKKTHRSCHPTRLSVPLPLLLGIMPYYYFTVLLLYTVRCSIRVLFPHVHASSGQHCSTSRRTSGLTFDRTSDRSPWWRPLGRHPAAGCCHRPSGVKPPRKRPGRSDTRPERPAHPVRRTTRRFQVAPSPWGRQCAHGRVLV